MTGNGAVTLVGNDFGLEDAHIAKNAGPVLVRNNVNLSLSVIENASVRVIGNTVTDAEVSKNSGGTQISRNTGETLSCSDNRPAPTGGGNVFPELKDGQCATL